jgi:hypothetical protein
MERGWVEDKLVVYKDFLTHSTARRPHHCSSHHPNPTGADHAQDANAPKGMSYLTFDSVFQAHSGCSERGTVAGLVAETDQGKQRCVALYPYTVVETQG